MEKDPIVEEVRMLRDKIAQRFDYDIDAIVRAFRQRSIEQGHATVSLPPKPTSDNGDGEQH